MSTAELTIAIFTAVLLLLAFIADKGFISKKITHSSFIYTLSLASYAGAWAIFGTLDFAQTGGYVYLAFYFGSSALFLLSPLFAQPILHLCQTYKLGSLADIFSFRYCSQSAGIIVTLGLLIGLLPIMAIQIEILVQSAKFVHVHTSNEVFSSTLIEAFTIIGIVLFPILFATKQRPQQGYNKGFVFTLAMQSILKLIVLLTMGFVALYYVFEGHNDLQRWLTFQPDKLKVLNESLSTNNSRTLTLIFFAASLAMPHLFHLTYNENATLDSLKKASWGFPLYLLLLSLPVFPIIWASEYLNLGLPGHFAPLLLGYIIDEAWLSIAVFAAIIASIIGSLSVILLSMSSMLANHFILPFAPTEQKHIMFKNLQHLKRLLIVIVISFAYVVYYFTHDLESLNAFGYASYTAIFQFLPGIIAVLYWPKGNRFGLILGLVIGFLSWTITILLPLTGHDPLSIKRFLLATFDLGGDSYWFLTAAFCLGINMVFFGLGSLLTKRDNEQRYIAKICSQDDLGRPQRQQLKAKTITQIEEDLSKEIGSTIAEKQIQQAMQSLQLQKEEARPMALRLLRRQLEANLSALWGPTVARQIITRSLPFQEQKQASDDLQLLEHRLESSGQYFSGLTAELNHLRRYHRSTVESLPIGICSIDSDQEIIIWNKALAELSNIKTYEAVGANIYALASPWNTLLKDFISSQDIHWFKQEIHINDQSRWYTLHKTYIAQDKRLSDRITIIIEDVTATALLEKELLHNERLASIGRLAAGVAHEIGNPVTGIACLAQNLKYDQDGDSVSHTAKDILTQTERITRIVQSLVNFSHAGSFNEGSQKDHTNIKLCIDDAIHLLALSEQRVNTQVMNNITDDIILYADSQALLQVFINLIQNALFVIDEISGTINIDANNNDQYTDILISDNGPGIAKDIQDNIFEPFFTTKEPGEGTGLGLSLVYSIIEEHQGKISLTSPVDTINSTGTCFTLRFAKTALPS